MSEQWKRLRDLKAEADDVAEQKSSLADEAKDLRESIDGLIADGSKAKDWKELRRLWGRLDRVEAEKKALAKEIKDLRGRMAALVKTGDDPEDDGQTSIRGVAIENIPPPPKK
jgi:predicted  nucleic acid-binding Zn-ribbon protein